MLARTFNPTDHTSRRARIVERGFTLIEMLVVAPIVILSIGAFIALIINLTGEVMSSRGSNSLAYDVQDTLNRIEQDVKLSTGFLAYNNIPFDATNRVQSFDNGTTTTLFENTGNGTGPILILNSLVTTGNPTSLNSSNVYLKDQPNDCSNPQVYIKNRPMTQNIVYFVKNNSLWRRTIMPSNYTNSAIRCGNPPWQQASCAYNYSSSFCATNDVRLIDNASSINFSLYYFTNASSTVPIAGASDAAVADETRATSLQAATTVVASISAQKTIAGRDITREGTLRATRLDTNATSVAIPSVPTSAPAIPVVSGGTVTEGHHVTYTWPQVPNATAYDLQYRINGGSWQSPSGAQNRNNASRTYTITDGTHTDTIDVQVRSKTTCTTGTCTSSWSASSSTTIPLWAPLVLENGWIRYHTTYSAGAYTKTKAGVVMIKGMLKGGTSSAIVAALPADYRPSITHMYEASANNTHCRIDVQQTGEIVAHAICSNVWMSLDGIRFLAADAPTIAAGTLTLQNSWVNYATSTHWGTASYGVDNQGRVHTRGLIKSGTVTDGALIATLPAGLAPNGYMHVTNINTDTSSQIGISASGQLLAKGGSYNSFLSVVSMFQTTTCPSGATCSTWNSLPLVNSWAFYGGGYSAPQYTKASDGIVMVKGLIASGANQATIANLPAGFCPKERLLITITAVGGWGRADVVPNAPGAGCYVFAFNTSTTWTSLDAVSFMAEQ